MVRLTDLRGNEARGKIVQRVAIERAIQIMIVLISNERMGDYDEL